MEATAGDIATHVSRSARGRVLHADARAPSREDGLHSCKVRGAAGAGFWNNDATPPDLRRIATFWEPSLDTTAQARPLPRPTRPQGPGILPFLSHAGPRPSLLKSTRLQCIQVWLLLPNAASAMSARRYSAGWPGALIPEGLTCSQSLVSSHSNASRRLLTTIISVRETQNGSASPFASASGALSLARPLFQF